MFARVIQQGFSITESEVRDKLKKQRHSKLH